MTKIRRGREGEGDGGGGGKRGGSHGFLTTHTRSFLWPEPHLFNKDKQNIKRKRDNCFIYNQREIIKKVDSTFYMRKVPMDIGYPR